MSEASSEHLVLGDQLRDSVGLALLHEGGEPHTPQAQHREIHRGTEHTADT